jgi:hypothetical protein
MRKAVRLVLPGAVLLLVCFAARAQPAQPQPRTQPDARCRDVASRYVHPSPYKPHLTVEEEDDYEYAQAKKYLALCGDSDDQFTLMIKDAVAGYEAEHALARLLRAARKPGSPESGDPNTYAAIAAAYEVRLELASKKREDGLPPNPRAVAARAEAAEREAERLLDAYARAVAACGAGAGCRPRKAAWEKRLAELYRSRHGGSDAGLGEFVAGALTKPLPLPKLSWWLMTGMTDER